MLGYLDSHSLGLVAYAKVKPDASTPHCNSGMVVTMPATGVYQFVLPFDLDPDRTLLTIQPYVDHGISGPVCPTYVLGVDNGGPDNKTIQVEMFQPGHDGSVLVEYGFDIKIYRTVVPNELHDPT